MVGGGGGGSSGSGGCGGSGGSGGGGGSGGSGSGLPRSVPKQHQFSQGQLSYLNGFRASLVPFTIK